MTNKVILVGNARSGKTSIARQLAGQAFQADNKATEILERYSIVGDGVEPWTLPADMVNDEKVFPEYCKESRVALVAYDVTDTANGLASAKAWLKKVRDQLGEDFPVILVGNKTDVKGGREVTFAEAKKLVGQGKDKFTNLHYVSAKTGHNLSYLSTEIQFQQKIHRSREENGQDSAVKKVVVLGQSGAGKTNLMKRIADSDFEKVHDCTVGFQRFELRLGLEDGKEPLNVRFFDIGGDERYAQSISSLYKDTDLAVIVFDITDAAGLGEAEKWLDRVRSVAGINLPVILVGNKSDKNKLIKINYAKSIDFTKEHGIHIFLQTSAKSRMNIPPLKAYIFKSFSPGDTQELTEDDISKLKRAYYDECSFFSATMLRIKHTLSDAEAVNLIVKHAQDHHGAAREACYNCGVKYQLKS